MKTLKFKDDERVVWLYTRRGKITGTRAKELVGKRDPSQRKLGFYELIAERLGLPPEDDENQMERGARLEGEAIDRFAKETGKAVDKSLLIWVRDDNESIAVSPDGVIGDTEAVEAKCLSSARHIEAFLTKRIPPEFEEQALQYFVVNDKLETLHFVFFDPRFALYGDSTGKQTKLDYFTIPLTRAEVQAKVEEQIIQQRKILAEVNEIVNRLTF